MSSSFQVVADLLMGWRFLALDQHLHLALLGPNDHGLLPHPSHHIERTVRLPPQGQFQNVLLNAPFDDLAQFLGNGKEAICWTQPLQGLMGPSVVVVLHPQTDALTGGLKAVKLRSYQELLPDRLPEPFDLAQGHGMMRPALEVVNPILAQLRLEARGPAPARVLASLIGKHLFGHPVLRHCRAVHLQDVLGCLAAKHVQPHQVAGVIIQKADKVGVLATQTEGEDVGLPHLVGRGTLEEARLRGIAPRLGFTFLQQLLLMERAANGLPAHRQKQHPPQELADLLNAQVGMMPLEFDNFRLHGRRHLRPPTAATPRLGLQARFALLAVQPHPLGQRASTHAHFAGHPLHREPFFQTELNRFAPHLKGMGMSMPAIGPPRRPPRGAGPLLLSPNFLYAFHG
jgi:hypothetical protein